MLFFKYLFVENLSLSGIALGGYISSANYFSKENFDGIVFLEYVLYEYCYPNIFLELIRE